MSNREPPMMCLAAHRARSEGKPTSRRKPLAVCGVLFSLLVLLGCAATSTSGDRSANGEELDLDLETWEIQAEQRREEERRLHEQYAASEDGRFALAKPGQVWVLKSEHVALMHRPETPLNRTEFDENLIVVLDSMSLLEIVESRGILSPWKRVYFLRDTDHAKLLHGWILAETVKRAGRLK